MLCFNMALCEDTVGKGDSFTIFGTSWACSVAPFMCQIPSVACHGLCCVIKCAVLLRGYKVPLNINA